MKAPVSIRVLTALLVSCAGPAGSVDAPSADAPRVFVEAVLAKFDSSELALVRTLDIERVIAGNSPDLISTLGGLADQGTPLVLDRDAGPEPGNSVALDRFEVTPALTSDRAVRLDMKLDVSTGGHSHRLTKADVFVPPQLLVWDTDLKTPSGESIVVLVQPTVIESERDLKAILERRSVQP